jgi:hypothetical protein
MRCILRDTRYSPTPRIWGFVGVAGFRAPMIGESGTADSLGVAQSRSFP